MPSYKEPQALEMVGTRRRFRVSRLECVPNASIKKKNADDVIDRIEKLSLIWYKDLKREEEEKKNQDE